MQADQMLRPESIHASIVDRLGRAIAGGTFAPAGALPREDEIAARFTVSRTVVREATRTLQALGLVATRPRTGTRVRPAAEWRLLDPQVMGWISEAGPSPAFIRDLIELRQMIEPAASALAAERASPVDVEGIRAATGAMASARTVAAHQRADFAFHETILSASGNILLLQLTPVMHGVLHASFALSMHDRKAIRASVALHEAVAHAIAARRPDEARAAMSAVLDSARRDIERGLAKATTKPRGPRPTAGTRAAPSGQVRDNAAEELPHDRAGRTLAAPRA